MGPSPELGRECQAQGDREPGCNPGQAGPSASSRLASRVRLFLDLLELELGVLHALDATLRLLAQAALDQPIQLLRHPWHQFAGWLRLLLHQGRQDFGRGVSSERSSPRHHLVEQRPEAENVAARVDRAARRLLRRHVADRSRYRRRAFVRLRLALLRARLPGRHEPGQAEIQDLDRPLRAHHYVAGLQVAVHDPRGVRARQGVRDRDRHLQHLVEAHPLARDRVLERPAERVLHDDEVDPVHGVDLVHGYDVGMVERGGGPGFLDEAPAAAFVRHALRGKHLDRDVPTQARVARAIDFSHASRAQQRGDLVWPEPRPG